MNTIFDNFGMLEKPYMVLCNPDGTQLFSLDTVGDLSLTIRFNAMSEINFTIPKTIENNRVEAYNYIVSKRYILLEGYGYFIIQNPEEHIEGDVATKNVTAISVEMELNYKRIVSLKGTKEFGALLETVVSNFPNWSIDHVDSELIGVYRYINVTDNSVYNFLVTDLESYFNCVFKFDYLNRKISAYTRENSVTPTDIYLSADNVVRSLSINEKSDELTTCFYVTGKDIDIRNVNPLGTNTIYNFDHFKNTAWMTQDLVDAIDAWENIISVNQEPYSNYLIDLIELNEELLALQVTLSQLQTEYQILYTEYQLLLETKQPPNPQILLLNNKQMEINTQGEIIDSQKVDIAVVTEKLSAINQLCIMENNFTTEQLRILSSYIIENTYDNQSFIQTSIMTPLEAKYMALSLYNLANEVLARASRPRIDFSVDSTNIIFEQSFSRFADQLVMGAVVTIEIEEDSFVDVNLLELVMSFDDPENFSMSFGNALRLDDAGFIYSDLYGQTIKSVKELSLEGASESISSGPASSNVTFIFENGLFKGYSYD